MSLTHDTLSYVYNGNIAHWTYDGNHILSLPSKIDSIYMQLGGISVCFKVLYNVFNWDMVFYSRRMQCMGSVHKLGVIKLFLYTCNWVALASALKCCTKFSDETWCSTQGVCNTWVPYTNWVALAFALKCCTTFSDETWCSTQ